MAPSANDVFRVTAKMSIGSDDVQNVYHLQAQGGAPASNAAVLADIANFMDDAYAEIAIGQPTSLNYDTIEVYNLTAEEYVGETAWPTLTAGTGADANLLPPQLSPLVLFLTGVLRSVGRKFLPMFVLGNIQTDGSLSSSALTAMAGYAAILLAGYAGSGYTLVPGNYRPLTELFIEWTEAVVRDLWATQRGRYFGSGS